MASLDSSFEADLREAVLDDVQSELVGQQGNVVHEAIQQSRAALEDFADQYNVAPIFESLDGPHVDRQEDSITVRWSFEHEAAGYFEFGTPDNYEISASDADVLSFVWEDPPAWVREEFDPEGDGYRVFFPSVDSGEGIAETRFTRIGLRWLRLQLRD